MFDPITIGACLTTASTAFAGLKKAFQEAVERVQKDTELSSTIKKKIKRKKSKRS